MKTGDKVKFLVDVPDVCDKGQTGTVDQCPFWGHSNCALVSIDDPKYRENEYLFDDFEIEIVNP